jgi:YVTN family beta-propeller protein
VGVFFQMSARAGWIMLALSLSLSPGPSAGSDEPSAGAQIVVYLEVPAGTSERTVLTLSGASLRGVGGEVLLEPVASVFDSREIAGGQLRFVDQAVPSASYLSLALGFARVQAHVGAAPVEIASPTEPVLVPLDVTLPQGRSTLLVVRWVPSTPDPEAETHVPSLDTVIPEVPPPGSVAFVTNEGSGNVSVIDRRSYKVVDVIRVGEGPRGIAGSRVGRRLYVVNAGSDEVTLIDTASRRVVRRALLRFGDEPSRILLSPDEREIYVLNYGSNILSIMDAETLQETRRIPVESEPRGMDIDAATGLLYVASELSHSVLVLDPAAPENPAERSVDVSPTEILLDRTADQLYVSSANQRRLSVVNPETFATTDRLSLCSPAVGLVYSPRSRQLYASLAGCREITILNPASGLEIGSIATPGAPGLISLDPERKQLLVTIPSANELAFCNVNSHQWVGFAKVGEAPYMSVVPR